DPYGDEWHNLAKQLKVDLSHIPALIEVLRQGRWRNAGHPRAYVKKALDVEVVRMGIEDPLEQMHLKVPRGVSHDQYIDHRFAPLSGIRTIRVEGMYVAVGAEHDE